MQRIILDDPWKPSTCGEVDDALFWCRQALQRRLAEPDCQVVVIFARMYDDGPRDIPQ